MCLSPAARRRVLVPESMLELSVADGDSCPVITLSGQADLTTLADLAELITAQLSRRIAHLVVDVSELTFADSISARVLVLAALTLKDRGGGMVLVHPQRPVARVLAVAGADRVMTIDEEAGITAAPQDGAESAL